MAQTKFIYFDLGNVICPFEHGIACEKIADLTGIDKLKVKQAIFETDLQTSYESGKISSRQFHDEFCRLTGSSTKLDDFLLACSDMFVLNYSIMPLIAQLRSANFPMGILSSTCEAHWNFICRRYPTIDKYFTWRILSYEIKCMKPDAGIYEAAIRLAKVSSDEIFFMDDRLDNVEGALKCGIDAVLFESTAQLVRQLAQRGLRVNL